MVGNIVRFVVSAGVMLGCAVVSGCGDDALVAVAAESFVGKGGWAGFAVGVQRRTDVVDEQIFFHEVSGRWINPKVDCALPGAFPPDYRFTKDAVPKFSVWVGLGGSDKFGIPAGALPQVGLETGCTHAGSVPIQETKPWTELFPKDPNYDAAQWTVDPPGADRIIQPGDIVDATLVAEGVKKHRTGAFTSFCTDRFRFELKVSPAGDTPPPFSLTASAIPPSRSDMAEPCRFPGEHGRPSEAQYLASAEWIVERGFNVALPVGGSIEWLSTNAKASVFRTHTSATQVPQQHSGGERSGPVNAAEWVVKRYEYHDRQGWTTEDPNCAAERALLVPTPQLFRYVHPEVDRPADDTTRGAFVVKNLAPPYCPSPPRR
jgi:hypothetical protein